MSFSRTYDSSNDGACQQSSYVFDESRSLMSCGAGFAPARALDRRLEALSLVSYNRAESGIDQSSSGLEYHTCVESPKASSILQVNRSLSSVRVKINSFKKNDQLEKCLNRRFVGRDVSDELEIDKIKRKLQSNLDIGDAKLVLYQSTIRQLQVSVNFMEINPITSGYGASLTEFKLQNSKIRLGKLLTAVLMVKDNLDSLRQTLALIEGRGAVLIQPVSCKFVLLKSIYDVYDKLC